MSRAAIYTRISTVDQSRYSLDNQAEACRAFARAHGHSVVGEWQDQQSGRDPERPGYQAMLAARDSWDVVIVWRLDRLGRDEAEYFVTIAELSRAGRQVLSATEPNGSAVVSGILAVLAAEESRRIAERVRPGLVRRASEGKWSGRVAFGMKFRADGTLEPDPDPRCRAVDLAFAWYDPPPYGDGLGAREIARRLNALGYRAPGGGLWSTTRLVLTLHQAALAGRLRAHGVLIEAAHPGRIDPERFERVQARLVSRRCNGVSLGERPDRTGAGLLYCHCGARLSYHSTRWVPVSGEAERARRYGQWACLALREGQAPESHVSVSALHVERELRRVLAELRLPSAEEIQTRAEAEVRRRLTLRGGEDEADRLSREVERLRRVEANLIDMRASGEIDREQFAERIGPVRASLESVRAELARVRQESGAADLPARLLQLRALVADLAGRELDTVELAAVVAATCERLIVERDRTLRVEWRPGAELLLG